MTEWLHLIMVGAATVLVVSDIARSVEHYCDGSALQSLFNMESSDILCNICVVTRLLCTYLRLGD